MTSAKPSQHLTTLALSGLLLLGEVAPARAADLLSQPPGRWGLCGAPLTPPPLGNPGLRNAPDTPLNIEAGQASYDANTGDYTLLGRPVITRADQRLKADRMHYNEQSGRVDAEGDVYYEQSGAVVEGDRGHFNLNTNSGAFSPLHYRIAEGHIHGDAAHGEMKNPDLTTYKDARFSTCQPGEEDWWLHSGSLTIDQKQHEAFARDVWLSFHGIPFAYTPFISFPVGVKRKTGFLTPVFGNSATGGFEFGIPWYWNIAPNYDATITPTVFTKRGVRLGTEFRYLLPWAAGRNEIDYLPQDMAAGRDRWLVDLNHHLHLGQHLRASLKVNRVSDDHYLDDFGNNLQESSTSALENRLEAELSFRDWSLSAQIQRWQTIAPNFPPSGKPYSTLPRIRFDFSPSGDGLPLRFNLESELVRFLHPNPDVLDTGYRLDLMPQLTLPFKTLGYFLEPGIAYRYTTYRLHRPDSTLPENPSRGLPIYSVDSGLYLERELRLFNSALTQTLEPRLFYLYVPKRNQNDLPVFDTTQATFTFYQLFETNRFTGPDRMGDANQLTAAITSRLLSASSGYEYLRFSIGQIFYFRNREVTLPGVTEETTNSSDYVTELRAGLPGLMNASVDYRWNPHGTNNRRLTTQLQLRKGPENVLNLGYRLEEDNGHQILSEADGSFGVGVGASWHLVGGWNYSFLDKQTQERFAGVEYDSCCYAVRGLFRQFQANTKGISAHLQTGFLLQFEFKGLGAIGDEIPKFLRESIPGFRPES